jgi:PAS domain S-box-containing protein
MKLRAILILLSFLAFASVSAGGYLHYQSLRKAALKEAERQGVNHTETIKNHFSFFLTENLKSVKALAGLPELRRALSYPGPSNIAEVHLILDHFKSALDADVCYLMSRDGSTLASSNRNAPDSFLGQNYEFRPYFRNALHGRPTVYLALGITSEKRGIYCSHPVYGEENSQPLGVAVVKASITPMEKEFSQTYNGIASLVSPEGVIFLSNREDWLYRFIWAPSQEHISRVAQSRQFGDGPWEWAGLRAMDGDHASDLSGREYVLHKAETEHYPGWTIIYLQSMDLIRQDVSRSFMKTTGFVILAICGSLGVLILLLYKKASHLIAQRKSAEEALRESEETALALLNAPTQSALLLGTTGKIIALNKTAAERFGSPAPALIGRCAFELFSSDVAKTRKAHHERVLHSGRPVRYEDRREERWFNTHVYPVFDKRGRVVRVAIFSEDVSEQKEAEQALKSAQEELTRYSRDLEKRVEKRTQEITGILKYTPAVVFLKDRERRYTLVNSRFEELFNLSSEEVQGKTDEALFSPEEAQQWKVKDEIVLTQGESCQVEEVWRRGDGFHTYLVVKFPLFDEQGSTTGLCGIATDITALKKAQDQLRKLSASVMSSQEKERMAIARELHDELGQILTALRIDLVWIWDRLKRSDAGGAERVLAMCELIDKTIDEVRGMAVRLRPGVLDDLGLIPALDWYTSDFEKRTGIACTFRHDGVDEVGDVLATAAYRITQEALTNVARHAFARQVEVSLRRENGLLTLSVADDGQGYHALDLSSSEGLGVAGMQERATLVGGSLQIESTPGKGVRVHFRVPFGDFGGESR